MPLIPRCKYIGWIMRERKIEKSRITASPPKRKYTILGLDVGLISTNDRRHSFELCRFSSICQSRKAKEMSRVKIDGGNHFLANKRDMTMADQWMARGTSVAGGQLRALSILHSDGWWYAGRQILGGRLSHSGGNFTARAVEATVSTL